MAFAIEISVVSRKKLGYNKQKGGDAMSGCKDCTGNCCKNCGGCGGALELSQGEIDLLQTLGQFSFLPIARKIDDMTPIYREENTYTEEQYSLFIQLLEQKQLIYLDYTPLSGAKMGLYPEFPVHGSMGLTKRGQDVLETLEVQGAIDN